MDRGEGLQAAKVEAATGERGSKYERFASRARARTRHSPRGRGAQSTARVRFVLGPRDWSGTGPGLVRAWSAPGPRFYFASSLSPNRSNRSKAARKEVARNPSTPVNLLRKLANNGVQAM